MAVLQNHREAGNSPLSQHMAFVFATDAPLGALLGQQSPRGRVVCTAAWGHGAFSGFHCIADRQSHRLRGEWVAAAHWNVVYAASKIQESHQVLWRVTQGVTTCLPFWRILHLALDPQSSRNLRGGTHLNFMGFISTLWHYSHSISQIFLQFLSSMV